MKLTNTYTKNLVIGDVVAITDPTGFELLEIVEINGKVITTAAPAGSITPTIFRHVPIQILKVVM